MGNKFIKHMLGVAFVFAFFAACAFSANATLLGDINKDGEVSSSDARDVLRASVGLDELTDEQKLLADIDANNKVNSSDARLILRTSVGLETEKHYYEKAVTLEPTCTENGTMKFTCTECDDAYEKVIDALGHSFPAPEIITAVTCDADGLEKYTCDREGCTHTEERTVPAGHVYDIPAATCTQAQYCTRGNHLVKDALGHTTDWDKCSRCKVFVTDRYATEAATIKAKFNEAKKAFDAAYSVNSYNAMLDGISWKCLPNTIKAKPYYEAAKAAYQAAYDACGNIAEFAEIKALFEKNIYNLTISIEEANKIITFCDGNGGRIDTTNYEDMVAKLETYNAGFWNNDYKDHTVGNNKKLAKEIKW